MHLCPRCLRLPLLAAFAWAAAGPSWAAQAPPLVAEGPVVTLPPLIVEEKTAPLRWYYFQQPGLEVLSTSESHGRGLVERIRDLEPMLALILPERFRAQPGAVPDTVILADAKYLPAPSRGVIDNAVKQARTRVQFLPNLRFADLDASTTLVLASPGVYDFALAEEGLESLLESRTPRLPGWFIAGMRGFYHSLLFRERDIWLYPLPWRSETERLALRKDPETPRMLLPFEEMLTHRPAAGRETDTDATWRAQCALFIHWALLADNGVRRDGLWSLLDQLDREPASEALFVQHLGLGYADLRDALSYYLPRAVRGDANPLIPVRASGRPPKVEFRLATELEVTRMRGDLERMQVSHVRSYAPNLVPLYLAQARGTLAHESGAGGRDPRLLAITGLLELDNGQPDTARLLLEAAVQGNVQRPRAYFELARLRFTALANTAARNARLTRAQVDSVAAPLLAGHRLTPSLFEIPALLAIVLLQGADLPSAEQLEALHEGARAFPYESELVARAILLHRAAGQPAAAAALTQLGLRHAPDAAKRAWIEQASGMAAAK